MLEQVSCIAKDTYRLTLAEDEAALSYSIFLIAGTEPVLFHTGNRRHFPVFRRLVAQLIPLERLKVISFSHLEGDECGALSLWRAACPNARICVGAQLAQAVENVLGCDAIALASGEATLGAEHCIAWLDTPHLPHSWEAGMLFDTTTGTLFGSDLGTQMGWQPAISSNDRLASMLETQARIGYMPLGPVAGVAIDHLLAQPIERLAVMHGASLPQTQARAYLLALRALCGGSTS